MSAAVAQPAASAVVAPAEGAVPATPRDAIERALAELDANKNAWVAVGLDARVALLAQLRRDTWAACQALVADALEAKGIPPGSAAEADEWTAGPYAILRNLRLLERALRETRAYGAPRLPTRPSVRPNGQVVAQVFPADAWDRVVLRGYTAEIWMDPSVTSETLEDTMAVPYRAKHRGQPRPGKVALVLGAGNVTSIGPMDVLYKLFVEDHVVVLKTHPVNDYTGRFVERAFASLIDAGFLRVVYGGAREGKLLSNHPLVDEIHITGSDETHDAIVFGAGAEGQRNKAAKRRRNRRRVTSELGNVTPVIVVPGRWSKKDLHAQGVNLASSLTNNAGFNCASGGVFVQHAGWNQRGALLDQVRGAFERTPTRRAYYPGAAERMADVREQHPEAESFGTPAEGHLPWTLVPDVDPDDAGDICFTTESFCSVVAETGLSAGSVADYVDRAVRFCNNTLWGSLAAMIVVHPGALREPATAAAVERAIADLRYGTVMVNHFPGLGYAMGTTTWGAWPDSPLHDIQSGRDVVHNTNMFARPQKTVVRGPFRPSPKPPFWLDHRRAVELGRRLTAFEAAPSVAKLLGVAWSGLRG